MRCTSHESGGTKLRVKMVDDVVAIDHAANEQPEAGPVTLLLTTLDRFAKGMLMFESDFRRAVAGQNTGTHTLQVRLDGGQVREVLHTVQDRI